MIKGLRFFIEFGWKCEKKYIIFLVLNQLIKCTIPLVATIMPRYIINELMYKQRLYVVFLYTMFLIGYTLLANALGTVLSFKSFKYRCRVAAEFDVYIHKKMVEADYSNLESAKYIEAKEKAAKFIFGDMHGFSYVLDLAVGMIGKMLTLLGVVAIIALLHPIFVLVFVGIAIINSIVEARVRKKQVDMELEMTSLERKWAYYGEIMENFQYGKEIRINSLGKWLIEKERQYAGIVNQKREKSNNLGVKSNVTDSVLTFVQQGISYTYIIYRVVEKSITIGDFSMYISGILLFSDAMKNVITSFIELLSYRGYYDAMEEYLNIPNTMYKEEGKSVKKCRHIIKFENVYFKYQGQNNYALKDINLEIKEGERIAIVGENGSGKTTFIKLLCRIYDPEEGRITIDGMDIKNIRYEEYAKLFSVVFQDSKLYSFSLKENIILSQDYCEKKWDTAIKEAGLKERIEKMPRGKETNIYRNFDDEGIEPSGGEAQKIALARAIYKDAPFFVLDEPTAALDPQAENELYKRFGEITKNKTTFFVTHRLESTKFCEKILMFSDGEIVEYGTHSELMEIKGKYAKLYKLREELYNN